MPLINCKVHLEPSWTKDCVKSDIGEDTTFQITSTKLYVSIVTLLTTDNVMRLPLDASFQGVNRLFVLAFNNTFTLGNSNAENDDASRVKRKRHRKYFLPRVNIINYNVLIDGRSFYDQPINNKIKKWDEIRKIATGQGDDYTTGCLLDYQYFTDHFQLIAVGLSKQKELDAYPRATQQIEFYGNVRTNSQAQS